MKAHKILLFYIVFILIISIFSNALAFDWFGNQDFAGSNKYTNSNRIIGSNFTANGSGVCYGITAYLEHDGGYTGDAKFGIYYASNWTRLGFTGPSPIGGKGPKFWESQNLISEVNIVEGTKYLLVSWAELDLTDRAYMHYDTADNEHCVDITTFNGFPNTLSPDFYGSYNFTIYARCNYTDVWENTCPSSSSESPTNNTAGIDIDGDWSISITDIDGNTTDGQLWCQQTDTYYNWSGLSNGTKTLVLSTLDYLTEYKIYCNYSDENCNKYEWYFFTTEGEIWENTCPTSSGLTIANSTENVTINTWWNVTITDIDGNTTSGFINCSSGNETSWSNQANGTRSLELNGLSYSTNYTIWLNFSDEHCNKYEWYWFITEDEEEIPAYNLSDYMNRTELNETFLSAYLNFQEELFVMVIALALLVLGISKKDSIIGFLCCYSALFLLLGSLADGIFVNISGTIIIILIFISGAIGTYKVYLAKREGRSE